MSSLFEDNDTDVGRFVMGEDGEEWFPFMFENLEGDRGCLPFQQATNPMEQEIGEYGETDSDNDVDTATPAGASGPGPPSGGVRGEGEQQQSTSSKKDHSTARARAARGAGSSSGSGTARVQGNDVGDSGAVTIAKQACAAGVQELLVPSPKLRLDRIKAEAKEANNVTETTQLKRRSRARTEARLKQRTAGGVTVGKDINAPSKTEERSWWPTAKEGDVGPGREARAGWALTTSADPATYSAATATATASVTTAKGNSIQNRRRLERNAREQKRSLKISQRIEDLRRLLGRFGVSVKTSKSAVLSEATDYIAHLQRQQAQYEAERARMLQLLRVAYRSGALPNTAICGISEALASSAGVGAGTRSAGETSFGNAEGAAGQESGKDAQPTQAAAAGNAVGGTGAPGEGKSATSKPNEGISPNNIKVPDTVQGMLSFSGLGNLAAGDTSSNQSRLNVFGGGQGTPGVSWTPGTGATTTGKGIEASSCLQQQQPPPSLSQRQMSVESSKSATSSSSASASETPVGSTKVETDVSGQATQGVVTSFGTSSGSGSTSSNIQRLPSTVGTGVEASQVSLSGTMTPGIVAHVSGTPMVTTPMALQMSTATAPPLEAAIRALSHVNYERVFRMLSIPMAIANVNGNLVDCNIRLTQVTGFRREEALFMTIFDLVADPFLQHTFSMISSILSIRGVPNPPFFQVLGKRRDGTAGGVVQISVVQDEALRPLHFSICVLESPGPGLLRAVAASTIGACGGGGAAGGRDVGLCAGRVVP